MLHSIDVQIQYLKAHGKSMSSLNTLEGHSMRDMGTSEGSHLSKGPSIMVSALASAMMNPTHGGEACAIIFSIFFFHIEYNH